MPKLTTDVLYVVDSDDLEEPLAAYFVGESFTKWTAGEGAARVLHHFKGVEQESFNLTAGSYTIRRHSGD